MQGLLIYIFGFSISVLFIALAEKIKDIQTKKTYRKSAYGEWYKRKMLVF